MEPTTASAPTAPDITVEPASGPESHAAEVTSWLLEGRFFTVDTGGAVTMWSPPAEEAFGWSRRDIVQSSFLTLLAPTGRDALAEELGALLAGSPEAVAFGAEADALDADGAHMRVALAAVPIHVGVGYEFNGLLQEIASSSQSEHSIQQLKARGESVLALIEDAVAGRHAELAESEDAQRLAGALVVFEVLERSAPVVAPDADGDSALHAELVDALREVEESRARAESARARMQEAVEECERLRAELAGTREHASAEAERLRAELAAAAERAVADGERNHAEIERLEAELAGSGERTEAAVARLTGELDAARAESEQAVRDLAESRRSLAEAQVEVERLGDELEAARDASDDAAAQLAEARRELSDVRAEVERRGGELEAARARDEAIRVELRTLSEEAAGAGALAERTSAELDRAHAELEQARAELDRASADLAEARRARPAEEVAPPAVELDSDAADERLAAEVAEARGRVQQSGREVADARERAERGEREVAEARRRAQQSERELAEVREEAQQGKRELAEARRHEARHAAETDTAKARAEALEAELATLAEQAAQARAAADSTRAELERSEAELAQVRATREDAATAGQETARLGGELGAARGELNRVRAELKRAKAAAEHAGEAAASSSEEVALLRAEVQKTQAELAIEREVAERAGAESRERIVELSADLEEVKTELASARERAKRAPVASKPPPEPSLRPAAPPDGPPVLSPNGRNADYFDFALPDESAVEDDAPPKPREPIAVETLLEMAREIDGKNRYTARHSERVAGYAAALAEGLGFKRPRIEAIRQAALLHDVGKSEVPEAILAKDEPLNLEELDELARHSQVGHELLVAASEPELAEWVRHIHERYDGGGFPDSLVGDEIPQESRVLHAADALDHMTRPRAYRRNRPLREALSELAFCAGTRLDPEIARTVIDLVEAGTIRVEGPAAPQRLGRPLAGPRGRGI